MTRLGSGNKYHNRKTILDGIKFDSKREAQRYRELKLLESAGLVSGIELQVPYELVPDMVFDGRKVQGVRYIADFRYTDENGQTVVEDAKGMRTAVYTIKKKLMMWRYGIKIREV